MGSEKILLAGKNGKSDADSDFNFSASYDSMKKINAEVEAMKKNASINKDFQKDMNTVKANLVKNGRINNDGTVDPGKAFAKGDFRKITAWSERNPDLILEVADNGKTRCYERKNEYGDLSSSCVQKKKMEYQEDDRVLGIPYAQAMAGDRVYIINGKVFTGWALYFSLSSIKSPEDYARNIDLVYNVPYLWGSILLKAQLGLGVGFNAIYGTETSETTEESLMKHYLFKTLRINTQKLVKTGFHLFSYGNAYWALRRGKKGYHDKITILQPERLKIFLDPMTTKILFYIYLPPIIGGTTIASYPDDGRVNPNIMTGVTLSYPTPIVIHPEDVCHFKINDFTEYPFGFSDVKTCIDPATARLDINFLAPILYKKYTKPMVHWAMDTEGLGPNQVEDKLNQMTALLQDMEPGSDPVTTKRWTPTVINAKQGKSDILTLTDDIDTQIFAATGAPEPYFKGKGSTDRMISEQDKTFISRLKVPQSIVGEEIEEKIIKPRLYAEYRLKLAIKKELAADGERDVVEEILEEYDSWMANEPKYPEVKWKETFKQDETQSIANAIAMLNAGMIDPERAAMKVGEIPPSHQAKLDAMKKGLDEIHMNGPPPTPNSNPQQPPNTQGPPDTFNEQENMENLRGGLKVGQRFDTSNRNHTQTKDPSQLGGSRYQQHALKGKEPDISQKHTGLGSKKTELQEGDEVDIRKAESGDVFLIKK